MPADDAQYNGLMAEQTLFTPLHISSDQIFKVDTSLAPAKAAEKYLADITRHFKEKPIEFDLIMLGLGDNAHTASLFPHTDVLQEKDATVKEVYLKEENIYRITMSAPLINQARNIAFLVFGDNKAEAVSEVLEGKQNVEQFPAQLIIPKRSLYWFLDKKATELLA